MGPPDSEIDTTAEMSIDRFVFVCVHRVDKLLELEIIDDDLGELRPGNIESVKVQ